MESITAKPTQPVIQEDLLRALRTGAERLRQDSMTKRLARIKTLRKALSARQEALHEAFETDLGRSPEAVDLSEVLPLALEMDHTLSNAHDWARTERVGGPLPFLGTRSEVVLEPKGVALIIASWNYPLLLTLGPLVSALAAGCSAIIKPSEFAPNVGAVISDIVESSLSRDEVRVVQGAEEVSKALVAQPFDHIYFTGSTRVGKAVARAAADNLSTLTLELGGKSPTIVDETADIDRAAERIAFGKFSNAGQTCLAPDYLFVHESRFDEFVSALDGRIDKFYGAPEGSPDYGKIVSERHLERLAGLCADAVSRGARVLRGGQSKIESRHLEPTLLTDVPAEAEVMQEEIFGPILPIFPYRDLGEVLAEIRNRPTPLALYLFSEDEKTIQRVVSNTNSGSVGINDTIIQFANPHLPFGGTGNSGQGRGHGHAGFLEFSSQRTVLRQRRRLALVSMFYPPYDELKRQAIRAILKRYRIG